MHATYIYTYYTHISSCSPTVGQISPWFPIQELVLVLVEDKSRMSFSGKEYQV